jgi:ureidoacrylate peracid hydrolase
VIYDLDPARSALLIIDAQNEYFRPEGALYTPHAAEIEDNLARLLDAARVAGARAVFVRHVHARSGEDVGRMGDFDDSESFVEGTPGVEIVASLAPRDGEPIVDKTRYSAFVNTRLESILKTAGVDTVIVTGLMTQFCSVTTARHAHDLDYRTVFVVDANAGPDLPDTGFGEVPHDVARGVVATMLGSGVAEVVDTETVLAELAATRA